MAIRFAMNDVRERNCTSDAHDWTKEASNTCWPPFTSLEAHLWRFSVNVPFNFRWR